MSSFDWYAASYRGDHGTVLGALQERCAASVDEQGRGRHGFAHAARLRADRGLHALVQWGGSHGDLVHVAFSGGRSGDCASVLRDVAPKHRVSRVDVAEDVAGPGAYQELSQLAARVAESHRIKRTRVVPDGPLEGSTIYLGSRSSPVFCRIYEKGKQVLSKGYHIEESELPGGVAGSRLEDWVRCEIEVKPKHPVAREAIAGMSPDDVWGCSAWSNQVRQDMGHLPAPRFNVGSVWRASNTERLYRALLTQYGPFLAGQREDLGTWECVGLQLGYELERLGKPRGCGGE